MKNSIKTIMEAAVNVPIDRSLLRKVLLFNNKFSRKNEDHINFLGGNLIGFYQLKYLDADNTDWIEEIVDIRDQQEVQELIYSLPDLERSWVISTSVVNLSMVYLAHKGLTSKTMSKKDGYALAIASLTMLQYKLFSSIHTRFFPHRTTEGIAMALYESIDRKSSIKRLGTWADVIASRSEDIVRRYVDEKKALKHLSPDEEVVKMVNDIQGRLKSIIKYQNDAYRDLRSQDARITTSDKFISIEGEKVLKDNVNDYVIIKNKAVGVIQSRNDFVKDDLMDVILELSPSANKKFLETTLLYLSDNHGRSRGHEIAKLHLMLLEYTFDKLRVKKIALSDVGTIMLLMRGLMKGSRGTNPILLEVKESMGFIVEDATGLSSTGVISSTKVAALLYIILRALVR